MSGWWWILIAWVALGCAYVLISGLVGYLADRRWERIARENRRKELRYETWRRVAGLRP